MGKVQSCRVEALGDNTNINGFWWSFHLCVVKGCCCKEKQEASWGVPKDHVQVCFNRRHFWSLSLIAKPCGVVAVNPWKNIGEQGQGLALGESWEMEHFKSVFLIRIFRKWVPVIPNPMPTLGERTHLPCYKPANNNEWFFCVKKAAQRI